MFSRLNYMDSSGSLSLLWHKLHGPEPALSVTLIITLTWQRVLDPDVQNA